MFIKIFITNFALQKNSVNTYLHDKLIFYRKVK